MLTTAYEQAIVDESAILNTFEESVPSIDTSQDLSISSGLPSNVPHELSISLGSTTAEHQIVREEYIISLILNQYAIYI